MVQPNASKETFLHLSGTMEVSSLSLDTPSVEPSDVPKVRTHHSVSAESGTIDDSSSAGRSAFEIDGVEVIEIYPIDKEETSLVVESNGIQFESINFTKGTGEEKFNFGRKMKVQGKVSRFHLLRKVKRKIPKAKTPVSDASAAAPIKTESVKQRDNVASVLKANEGEAPQEVGNEEPSAYEDEGTNGVSFAKEEQLIRGSTENEVIATENKPAPTEVPTAEKESPEAKESAVTEENKEIVISIEKEDTIPMERNYSREVLSVTMESAPANNEVELMQSSELLRSIKLDEDPTCNEGMPHIGETLPTESGQEQLAMSKRKPHDILGGVEGIVDKKKESEITASDVSDEDSILGRVVPASDIEADKPKEVESIEIAENTGAADTVNRKDVNVTEAEGEVKEKRDYHRDAKQAALPKAFSVVDPEIKLAKRRSSISRLIKSKSFRSLKVGALSLGKSIKSGHFKSESQKIGLATSAPSVETDTEQQHVDLDKAAEVQVKPEQTDLPEKRKKEIKKVELTSEGPGDSEGQEAERMSEWSNDQTEAYESTIEDVEATFVQQEAAKDVEPERPPDTERTEKKQPEAGENEEGPDDIIQEGPSDSSSHENSMRDASLLDDDLSTGSGIEEVQKASSSKRAMHSGCCGDMVLVNVPNTAETKMHEVIDGCFGLGMKLNKSMDDDSASVLPLDDGDDDDTFHTYDDDTFRDGDTLETADDTLEDVNLAIFVLKKHADRLGVTEYELLKKIQEAQTGREQQRKTDPIP